MLVPEQRLGEDICHIVVSRNVKSLHFSSDAQFPEEMISGFNVLGSGRVNWILGQSNSALVVTPECGSGLT